MLSIVPCCCGPGPCAPPTLQGQNVKGCSQNLAGCTVEAHDGTATGTLLASTTTNASGNWSLLVTGAISGHDIVLVFKKTPRHVAQTRTLTWSASSFGGSQWRCGATSTNVGAGVNLAPAPGYRCVACADPAPETLHITSSFFGSTTLNYDVASARWIGTYPARSVGFCGCTAATQAVPVSFDAGGLTGVRETWDCCSGSYCPYVAGCQHGPFIKLINGSITSCPTTFSWSGSWVSPDCPTIQDLQSYFVGANRTITVTVSE
jgi:hypothetical protein